MFNTAQNQNMGLLPLSTGIRNGQSTFTLNINGTLSASNALDGTIDGSALTQTVYTSDNQFFADLVAHLEASASIASAVYLGYDQGKNVHKVSFISNYPNQLLLTSFAFSGGSTSPTVSIYYRGGIVELAAPNAESTLQQKFQTITLTGTATAGAASTITLAVGSSAVNSYYKGLIIRTTGGTGSGQSRYITGYVGSTRVATVDTAWSVQPDATTTYEIKYEFLGYALPTLSTALPVWSISLRIYNNTVVDSIQYNANGQAFIYKWDSRTSLLPLSTEVYTDGLPYSLTPNTQVI
jgi:hypothetical protein